MQLFLASLYSERLSGAPDTSDSSQVESGQVDGAAADETRQSSAVPALSGSR